MSNGYDSFSEIPHARGRDELDGEDCKANVQRERKKTLSTHVCLARNQTSAATPECESVELCSTIA